MAEELTLSFKFECDVCSQQSGGEPQNKFVMQKGGPSVFVLACSKCAKDIEEHNAKILKPMQEQEEAEREQRKLEREAAKAEKKQEKELANLDVAVLVEQNKQIIALLTQMVQKDAGATRQ